VSRVPEKQGSIVTGVAVADACMHNNRIIVVHRQRALTKFLVGTCVFIVI
jgi:hypothetical protein